MFCDNACTTYYPKQRHPSLRLATSLSICPRETHKLLVTPVDTTLLSGVWGECNNSLWHNFCVQALFQLSAYVWIYKNIMIVCWVLFSTLHSLSSSTNTGTEYFKHGICSLFFSLQNAVCFIILTYLVPVLFTFYIQSVLKFKKIILAPKG